MRWPLRDRCTVAGTGVSRERVSVIEVFSELTQLPGTLQRTQSARKRREAGYEAAASSAGAPMMLRNLSSSRESSRETCIWLMPSSWAISDCERCSK
jgi:hypothetical protein